MKQGEITSVTIVPSADLLPIPVDIVAHGSKSGRALRIGDAVYESDGPIVIVERGCSIPQTAIRVSLGKPTPAVKVTL